MTFRRPLIVDWGIGGLGTVQHLPQDVAFHYLSDAGFTPYGKTPTKKLQDRLVKIAAFAESEWGCDAVVVACNAASSVLPGAQIDLQVFDVISAGVRVLKKLSFDKIGVIGGIRTIETNAYGHALPNANFVQVVAQPLSALVERGVLEGQLVRDALAPIVEELGEIDALLLACTHYPALLPVLKEVLPGVTMLDPAKELSSMLVHDAWSQGPRRFFTTGDDEQMRVSAKLAFGLEVPKPESLPNSL